MKLAIRRTEIQRCSLLNTRSTKTSGASSWRSIAQDLFAEYARPWPAEHRFVQLNHSPQRPTRHPGPALPVATRRWAS